MKYSFNLCLVAVVAMVAATSAEQPQQEEAPTGSSPDIIEFHNGKDGQCTHSCVKYVTVTKTAPCEPTMTIMPWTAANSEDWAAAPEIQPASDARGGDAESLEVDEDNIEDNDDESNDDEYDDVDVEGDADVIADAESKVEINEVKKDENQKPFYSFW